MSRLGKGLEDIFNVEQDISSDESVVNVDLDMIKPGKSQPRQVFDEEDLEELRDSIIEHGVLQPIILVKSGKGYEIVAGERRYRAAKMAEMTSIPSIIRKYTDSEKAELSLIENLQRKDLNPIEQSLALRALITEFSLSQEKVAESIGKSRSYVTNQLRLLLLPKEIIDAISSYKISVGHAKVLLSLKDESMMLKLYNRVIKENLSVRELERLCKPRTDRPRKPKDIHLKDLEKQLTSKYGRKVIIKKNKLEIYYYDNDDFDRVLEILK